jgi:hypothetical protein
MCNRYGFSALLKNKKPFEKKDFWNKIVRMAGLVDRSSAHLESDPSARGLWVKVPLADFLKSQEQKQPVTTVDIQHSPKLISHCTELFKKETSIKKLSCCELKGQEGVELLKTLRTCPLLRSLSLRSLSIETASPLIDLINSEFSNLKSLKIEDAPTNTLFMIEPGLINERALRTLTIAYQDQRYQPAQRSPRASMSPPTIPPLRLTPALRSPRQVSTDVESNALAQILQLNRSIRSIKLSRGKFRAMFFKPIATALENTSGLTTLTLKHFDIDVETGIAIGELLERNRSITQLDLSSTPIEENGQLAFARSLISNTTLTYLNLTGLPLTKRSYTEFTNSFLYNNTLTRFIFLFYTPRNEEQPDHLYKLVERNRLNDISRRTRLTERLITHLIYGSANAVA